MHYTRAMATPVRQSVEDHWRSIEHGVVVEHVSALPGGTSTEVLVSIRRGAGLLRARPGSPTVRS